MMGIKSDGSSVGPARRVYRNFAPLIGGKAVAGIISLAYMMIAARALGPGDYGVLVLVHSTVMAIDATVNFPAWQAVVRYGAEPLVDGRMPLFLRLIRFTAVIELSFGAFAVVLCALILPWVGDNMGWPPEARSFAVPYSLAALATVRSTPCGYLQLLRRFDLLGIHNAVSPVVRLLGAILAAVYGWGLAGFLSAWLCAAIAEWISAWIMALWLIRAQLAGEALFQRPTDIRAEMPDIARFMFATNADSTFGDLANRITPLAVGWVLGPAAAGYFAVAQRATTVISQPGQILGQAAYVELAQLANRKDGPKIRSALVRLIGSALITSIPIVVALIFFAEDIVIFLAGANFLPAALPLIWLAVARAVLLIIPSASSALVAMGRPLWSVASNLLCSVLMLPLLLILLKTFGLGGAGLYSLLQAVAIAVTLTLLVVKASRPVREKQLSL